MKTKIALVLMLAAAGCSKQTGSDCDAPINKGMDNFTQSVKAKGSDSPMQKMMLDVVDKLRTTFLARCKEDKWAPEASACFGTVASQADVKACEAKLTDDQRKKLTDKVREIMMSSIGQMRGGMGAMPGHPGTLQGSSAPAAGSGDAPAAAPPAAGSAAPATAGSAAPAAPAAPAAAGDKPAGGDAKPAGGGGGW